MQLTPYGPLGVRVVVDIDVITCGIHPELSAQRTADPLATLREVLRIGDSLWRVECDDYGSGDAPAALVDVGGGGTPYVLGLKRLAHLLAKDGDVRVPAAVRVSGARDLLLAC